jgi:subtilisin family serine protease
MVKIAIIDSGLNIKSVPGNQLNVSGLTIYKKPSGDIEFKHGDYNDTIGHGTMCLRIIHAYIENAVYFIVKIFDTKLRTNQKVLVAAINYCIKQQVDVINLSLGIRAEHASRSLVKICELAHRRKIIIIAADHNEGKVCFPACLPSVIGVGSTTFNNGENIIYRNGSPIEFYTNAGSVVNKFNGADSTSFSCCRITGHVARIISEKGNIGAEAVRKELIEMAVKTVPGAAIENS